MNSTFAKKSVIAAALLVASQAWASTATFLNVGNAATFVWNFTNVDGANLNASVEFTLASKVGSAWTFNVAAANTSSGAGAAANANRLVSFGIGVVNPELLSTSDTSGNWDTAINTNFPAFGKIDFCAYGGSNCAGGSNAGLFKGATDAFATTMTFKTAPGASGVTFTSPYAAKFQSVGNRGGSWELAGCLSTDADCLITPPRPPSEIPEPGTLTLAGLALLGFGAARGRRA